MFDGRGRGILDLLFDDGDFVSLGDHKKMKNCPRQL